MSWRRYIAQARSLPPRVIWRKSRRKVRNSLKRDVGWLRARLLGTDISDGDFLRALSGRFPTSQVFLDHLAVRKEPRFFLDPGCRQKSVTAIRACCPGAEALTVAAADRVCNHLFDLLGSGSTHLGEQVDWHVDFKTGHRWHPRQYYANIRHAPYPGGYDIKVPWELSRCQHFAWLGQAYWFTGDAKYAQEFVAQVTDWIEQNPPQFGVNWVCTMDVAIRAVNWLWGYYFFRDSSSLTAEFRLAFFKSMLAHGRHIMNNLEWSETLTSNHYLSDVVGLVYLGILLPEFKEARRWREFGLRELEKEMLKQVYADGVDFEASTSYHRLVAELFLSAAVLARINGHTFSRPFMDRLEKMLEFTMYVTKPDGTAPLIGDNDNGRLCRLKVWREPEREWVDHRHLLSIGAVLFKRDDFAQAAGNQWEEAVWLFGEKASIFDREVKAKGLLPLRLESQDFPDAGIYVMRHNDFYMVIDAGAVGQNGNGGHAHNDVFSFELYAYGQTWIVDPGTYVYTADFEARNRFRSTAYHNTVMVDGQEINRLDVHAPFRMQSDAEVHVRCWQTSEDFDLFDAEHNGYWRLPDPVTHRRQIYFDKKAGVFLVRDLLNGQDQHRMEVLCHFGRLSLQTDDADPLVVRTNLEGPNLAMLSLVRDGTSIETTEKWVSVSYGQRDLSSAVSFCRSSSLPAEFITILCPYSLEAYPSPGRLSELAREVWANAQRVLLKDSY